MFDMLCLSNISVQLLGNSIIHFGGNLPQNFQMGKLEFKRRKKFISDYKVHVTNAYKESTTKAIQEENSTDYCTG